MSECIKRGCRNLEIKCADCGRITATVRQAAHPACGECSHFDGSSRCMFHGGGMKESDRCNNWEKKE